MSFLSGILDYGKKAVSFLSGNSIWSSLAKTAILAYSVNKLSSNALKDNNSGTDNIDNGVRLQAKPDAKAKIPVLYGNAFFGGNISDAAMTNSNKTMWYSLVLAEKTGNLYSSSGATAYTFNNVYWNNQRIVFRADGITADYTVDTTGVIDRSISGLVKVYFYAGNSTSQQAPTGKTITAANAYDLFPNWTSSTHAMDNLIFALVSVDYNREKNITGIGDMLFNIDSTMKKPGDVIYDYLVNTRYGAGIDSSDIITNDITALNTYSLDNINYDDEGTGAETLADRYQINGLIDTANEVLQNAEAILSAAGSWLSYDTHDGKWGIVINKQESSIASFNDTNIIGNISLSGTGLQELYNEVKVEFPHRELRDSADYYNIALNKRNANEPTNILNLKYDIINEPIQAQMLALIELKQARLDRVIRFSTDFSYYNLKAGDVIDVTDSRFGFTNETFRIVSIVEEQDNEGALMMEITALQYDDTIYTFDDLYRYTRSDEDGIVTIGSIGVPGTPTVSKIEVDARPRVEITTTSPTGVVEGLEYWLTTDINEADDNLRSYTLIGTKRPTGGGIFTSGTSVTLEYQTSTSDFYIKTRGFNTTTVGPFSSVSGLVEFEATQVTDAITPNTSMFDGTGGLLAGLALVDLAGKLLELFDGDNSKSIFEKIFDIFQDETGVDLVGQASGGELVVSSNLEIKNDGTTLGATTSSIDFTSGLMAEGSGAITAKLIDGVNNKDILAWNASAGEWQLISGCITCDFAPPVVPPTPATPCSLTIASLLPGNIGTSSSGICKDDTTVPYQGSYFISYSINPGTATGGASNPSVTQYSPIEAGIGNVYLYGSDGSLEQQLTESQCIFHNNVVELPFAPRQPGKDYYILIDEGTFLACDCENAAISTSSTWSFRTSLSPQPAYTPNPSTLSTLSGGTGTWASELTVTSMTPIGSNSCPTVDFQISYSEAITAGSGSVVIKNRATGATVRTLSIGAASIVDDTAFWGEQTFTAGVDYDVTIPAGLVQTDRQATTTTSCGASATTPAGPVVSSSAATKGFSVAEAIEFVRYEVCPEVTGNASPITNIQVTFSKSISLGNADPAWVYIYETGGGLHQQIDLKGTFTDDGYHAVSSISGTTLTLNPTKPFAPGKSYYLYIPSGVIGDTCDDWAGTTTSTWQVDGIESEKPSAPTFGSVYIDLEFKRPVVPGNGKLNIVDATTGKLYFQLAATDPVVQISNTPFV